MRQTIRIWMVITFYVLVWVLQFNVLTDGKASQYLKEDMELAIHDAGLWIDEEQLAEGRIVFQYERAYDVFVESLERNTALSSLSPTSTSFFQDEFRVVAFEVFDDSNTTFPYQYSHPSYSLTIRFTGPTIFAIIETYGPRYFNGDKRLITRSTSYTYERE